MIESMYQHPQHNDDQVYPKEIVRGAWRLNYGEKFDEIHKAHPNIISTVEHMISELDLSQGADFSHRTIVDGDISLSLLNERESKRHYSLELPEGHFFLKEVKLDTNQITEGGFDEFKNAEIARELLKDVPGVEVVDYQFGFSNNEKNYIVTKWNTHAEKTLIRTLEHMTSDGNVYDTGESISIPKSAVLNSIHARIAKIKDLLADFRDVGTTNMAYDMASDTIIVFDINKGSSSLTESPDEEF